MTIMDESTRTHRLLASEDAHVAHNYHPLEVVVAGGSGAVLTDVEGEELPRLPRRPTRRRTSATATRRCWPRPASSSDRVTLTSRAFHHDQLAPFADALAALIGKDMVLPMNTGAEAVESGDQGGAQVGLRGQGRARRPGQDHRRRRQLPRPHHHDHQLLRRSRSPATTSARTPRASSPCRTATSPRWRRDHRRRGRRADRADPGRGRRAASRRRATWPGYAS